MSYSEADLVRELSRSWLSRSDRRWMEAELAKLRGASAPISAPVKHAPVTRPQAATQPTQPAGANIVIEGSPAFIKATEDALRLLQGTPSWVLATKLKGIRQVSAEKIGNPNVGGYVENGIFHAGDPSWRNDTTMYASIIAHEGAHAIDRSNSNGTARERFAFQKQAQALRELGASRSAIAAVEAHARNPTHHLTWNGPRG